MLSPFVAFVPRELFVTTALPYANGPLHIGHIMEYIQADIWVRYQRLCGHHVRFVGADDTHGAPIMLAAEKSGQTPQAFVADVAATRSAYLQGFLVEFDVWSSTDSPENHALAQTIYQDLKQAGLIQTRMVSQFFDLDKGLFLPDRFVKGQCPRCQAVDQYGDHCEVCGAVYEPAQLKDPRSTLSGTVPVLKESEHLFFKLSSPACVSFLKDWIEQDHLQTDVANKVKEWFIPDESGQIPLADWDISRDAPYFGIEIPDAPGKYFYVWLDAPIGYLSALQILLAQNPQGPTLDEYLSTPALEQYHFIGKDIITFHALFWPAILHFSKRKTPDQICVHGFLTINHGQKMSKSRGTGLDPLKYLVLGMDPHWLRYYFATKLSAKNEDIDFDAADFLQRVNSDLVGKYVNIASRAAGFIHRHFEGKLADLGSPISWEEEHTLLIQLRRAQQAIQDQFEDREFAKAVRHIMTLADEVNAYIERRKPWELAKDSQQTQKLSTLHVVCTTCLESFRLLTLYLKPILPGVARQVEAFLKIPPLDFHAGPHHLKEGHQIGPYVHLLSRVQSSQLEDLLATTTSLLSSPDPLSPTSNHV